MWWQLQSVIRKKEANDDKNNNIVLQVNRKRSDRLWDIKISYCEAFMRNLQSDNFTHPPTHTAIYLGKSKSFTTSSKQTLPRSKYSIKNTFINTFKGLENVVATNECTCLVDR